MPIEALSQANLQSGPSIGMQTTVSPAGAQRNPALDFTKGALVLIMVLYHWINYFIGPQWGYYEYLHFLTPSFIFISGFMVSNVYLSKYAVTDSRLPKRLVKRGFKLLAVFLVLNVARTFIVPVLGTGVVMQHPLTLGNIFTVFVSGNLPAAGAKLAAFPILVPISYLLMLSGALMFPYRRYKYIFHFACGLLLASVPLLGLGGVQSPYLESITIGLLGVMTGFIPISTINNAAQHRYVLAGAYLCYTMAITMWHDPFPLLVTGVWLTLMVIYLIGTSGGEYGIVREEITLLGKYSLLGYISQIAILQILSAVSHRMNLGFSALVISFFAAFILTVASVEVVDRARSAAPSMDSLYKAVFA